MPQMFLALIALFVVSTYSLGQLNNSSSVARNALQREAELAAADLARARLAAITERGYDEADAGRTSIRFGTTGLTSAANLGPDPGEVNRGLYDDVDDFHRVDGSAEMDSVSWDRGVMYFDVTTVVRYVDPSDPSSPAASPTLVKEIIVMVSERAAAVPGRRPVTAELRGVVSAVAQRAR
jgi:hypothetical protein